MSLTLDGVGVQYGRRMVVRSVDTCAQPGRILALVGPNGSGKTSLIKAVAGLVPYSGRIAFAGVAGRPKALGYMPQDQQGPMALSVVEVVLLGRLDRLHLRVMEQDLDAVRGVLRRLGIEHLAGRDVGELSGGSVSWSTWRKPWYRTQRCCFWMSLSARWTLTTNWRFWSSSQR